MLRKELVETIRTVHAGHRRVPDEVAQELAEHVACDGLSEREVEVLRNISQSNLGVVGGTATRRRTSRESRSGG